MKDSQKFPIQIIADGFVCVLDTGQINSVFDPEEFVGFLNEQGIVFGVNHRALQMIQSGSEESKGQKIVVARGKKPIRGLNARTILCYRAPEPLTNLDQLDFRKTVKLAKKDEVLLVKLRATQGTPGKNIYGETIYPEPGTDVDFIAGKNILKRYYEDKIEFSAFREGIVRRGKNNIQIESLHLVDHDINLNSGNLTLDSSVFINGSVMPTFKVSAGGSVTISGQVEKAEVQAKQDVHIYNLVTGGSLIVCGGDIQTRMVEHSTVQAIGDVTVEEDLLFADVTSGGCVVIGQGRGTVSGGVIRAARLIEVGSVGTPLGRQPELILGMDKSLAELETNIRKKDERITQLQTMMKQIRQAGLSTNDWAVRHLQKRLETLNSERADLMNCISKVSESRVNSEENKIIIRDKIKRGTTIRIGAQLHIVREDLNGGIFALDSETGKIIYRSIAPTNSGGQS